MTYSSTAPNDSSFQVFARAFSPTESSRHEVAHFSNYEAALTAAAGRVLGDLKAVSSPDQSARELFDIWVSLGDDVFITPDDPIRPFSATDFARLMTLQVTGDESRPLLLEVTCIDRLNFASGSSSPPNQWVFWVKAPATYTGATHLIRRAADVLYEIMSRPALESEGSSYTLLDMTTRELTEAQFSAATMTSPQKIVYTVQNDGSFAKDSP